MKVSFTLKCLPTLCGMKALEELAEKYPGQINIFSDRHIEVEGIQVILFVTHKLGEYRIFAEFKEIIVEPKC